MSSAWYAAFGLLALVSILNTTLLVAALRQTGEIYQLMADANPPDGVPAPLADRLVQMPIFHAVSGEEVDAALFSEDKVTVLAYVSPGCTACENLPAMLADVRADEASSAVSFAVITDSPEDGAKAFQRRHRLEEVPLLQADGIAAYFGITFSPFALAVRREASDNLRLIAGNVVAEASDLRGLIAYTLGSYGSSSGDQPSNGSAAAELTVLSARNQEIGAGNATPD